MNVGSLFSGIGGLDLGLQRAGWQHAFLCESDHYRRGVLAARFPGVPIYEDVRTVGEKVGVDAETLGDESVRRLDVLVERPDLDEGLDLLCGGFPCQDVSVAGRRAGLAGERSGLFFEFARVSEALRPRWLLVENVPGLLTSNGGRDFGVVLGTLADLGYGLAWRILDSRYFGVPQRRRRVFIVGAYTDGDPRAAAERAGQILAVGTRCERHPAARGEAREDVAVASLSGLGSDGPDDNDGQGGRLVTHTLTSEGHDAGEDGSGRGTPLVTAYSVSRHDGRVSQRESQTNLIAGTLREHVRPGSNTDHSILQGGVRRLMPVECERLQALPDGWTLPGPDSRRYAALGDAVTVNVAYWIGRRIAW